MISSPTLWGAGLACALGGAIAGNSLGSTPMTDRFEIEAFYQSHEPTVIADRPERRALPDRYPLVTRNAVVPVAELSNRGLFSQARYRAFEPAPVLVFEDAARPQPDFETREPIGAPRAQPTRPEPAHPPESARGPAQTTEQGENIDVQLTLTMR